MPYRHHRLQICSFILLVAMAFLVQATPTVAHGPVHDRIDAVNRDIEASPGYAGLYVVRADLYRLDRSWEAAAADLQVARDLGADSRDICLVQAHMHLDQGRFYDALASLAGFRESGSLEIMWVYVEAHRQLGDQVSALYWLNRCLKSPGRVPADWYLLRARLVLDRDPQEYDDALAGLEEGLSQRGFDVTLALMALDIEEARGDFPAALGRLDALREQFVRDEALLVRRGDLLLSAGRTLEAEAAYTEALAAIESLPEPHRLKDDTQKLMHRARVALGDITR